LSACFDERTSAEYRLEQHLRMISVDVLYCDGVHPREAEYIDFVLKELSIVEAQVITNLRTIVDLEVRYKQKNGVYLGVEPYPKKSIGTNPQEWDLEKTAGFKQLDWQREGKIYGTYWVEVPEDKSSLSVYAMLDIDGDGVFSTFTAGQREQPIAENNVDRDLFRTLSSSERSKLVKTIKKTREELMKDHPHSLLGASNFDLLPKGLLSIARKDGTISEQELSVILEYSQLFHIEEAQKIIASVRNQIKMKEMHREVIDTLNMIKKAEMSYSMQYDEYVVAEKYPPKSSDNKSRDWVEEESGGFQTLGIAIEAPILGTYWVDVDQYSFTATGIIDVDGDGVFATYTATKSESPNNPNTAPNVY
jgi:hypothetical protein